MLRTYSIHKENINNFNEVEVKEKNTPASVNEIIKSVDKNHESVHSGGGLIHIVPEESLKIETDKKVEIVNSTIIDDNNIYVTFNSPENKFVFYNNSNEQVGYFTIEHLVKYAAKQYDPKNQFLGNLDEKEFDEAVNILKQYLINIKFTKKGDVSKITILDYHQSPFICNLEMMIRLNNSLWRFEQDTLNNELAYVDQNYRHNIEKNVKLMIYLLLNYTLQLIAIVSEEVGPEKDALKRQLLKYSVTVVARITNFVQDQMVKLTKMSEKNIELLIQTKQLQETVDKKIEKLGKKIDILEQKQILVPAPSTLVGGADHYSATSRNSIDQGVFEEEVYSQPEYEIESSHYSGIYDL